MPVCWACDIPGRGNAVTARRCWAASSRLLSDKMTASPQRLKHRQEISWPLTDEVRTNCFLSRILHPQSRRLALGSAAESAPWFLHAADRHVYIARQFRDATHAHKHSTVQPTARPAGRRVSGRRVSGRGAAGRYKGRRRLGAAPAAPRPIPAFPHNSSLVAAALAMPPRCATAIALSTHFALRRLCEPYSQSRCRE